MAQKIWIAAGGTGGHIYPGLAVADALRHAGHEVVLCVSGKRPAERHALEGWRGQSCISGARPMRHVLANLLAVVRCYRAIKRDRPDCLFSTGGYTAFAPVMAARLLAIPVVLHEANAFPGKAIRFFARRCQLKALAVSFEETVARIPEKQATVTGFPIRQDLVKRVLAARQVRTTDPERPMTFLITGGSQGAHWVNETLAEAFCMIAQMNLGKFRLIHQCGKLDELALKAVYSRAGIDALVVPYIQDMAEAYAQADCVFARAGAGTCFELAACQLPAVFFPLPTAADDHQTFNAQVLANAGGALCLNQRTTTAADLFTLLQQFLHAPEIIQEMADQLKSLPTHPAIERLVATILEEPNA